MTALYGLNRAIADHILLLPEMDADDILEATFITKHYFSSCPFYKSRNCTYLLEVWTGAQSKGFSYTLKPSVENVFSSFGFQLNILAVY